MADLVTFGEMLLRLGAPGFEKIEQASRFEVVVTGAEMNSCVVAARLGLKTSHVTRLPRNPLGRMIENKVREHGIDTSHFVWTADGRVGLFFLEQGAMPRTSAVVYDRAHSSMSGIDAGEVDWKGVFRGAKLFHVGGTAPALSAGSARATKEAVRSAKKHGLTVSFDLNYRSKLWPIERARKAYAELLAFVDILILGEGDPSRIFGMKGADYRECGRRLAEEFGIKVLVVTRREDITVLRNNWTAEALADGRWHEDVTYSLEIVDRVGGGDAFTGGFLYGYLRFGRDVGRSLQYGNASCALKHAIPGDVSWSTLEEVEDLIRRGPGGGTGLRIRR